ncbi:QueT transporter family protein [Ruminococcaceae bacterium OttesenSCG-928-A16]|nr:QueT transporter family protein [Ruminococcaceae bacterium OttesenSCG-928-A16]
MGSFRSSYFSPLRLVRAALIAAVYVALCLVLAPFSFGPVQVRVSEALTLLPVLCPEAIVGVTLGCFIANMLASAPIDMIVGTAATLLAALATRKLRHVRWRGLPLAASLPPVLFNAVMVGVELTLLYFPAGSGIGIYLANMASVGIGQIISCCFLGTLLVWFIEKQPVLKNLFTGF